MNLYAVTADYRPSNPNKPVYYVLAVSKAEAKRIFQSRISWLKIYDVALIDDDTRKQEIINNPRHHIVLWG